MFFYTTNTNKLPISCLFIFLILILIKDDFIKNVEINKNFNGIIILVQLLIITNKKTDEGLCLVCH